MLLPFIDVFRKGKESTRSQLGSYENDNIKSLCVSKITLWEYITADGCKEGRQTMPQFRSEGDNAVYEDSGKLPHFGCNAEDVNQ